MHVRREVLQLSYTDSIYPLPLKKGEGLGLELASCFLILAPSPFKGEGWDGGKLTSPHLHHHSLKSINCVIASLS
jgi:hypothetical protein